MVSKVKKKKKYKIKGQRGQRVPEGLKHFPQRATTYPKLPYTHTHTPIYLLSQLCSHGKRLLSSRPDSRASVLGALPQRCAPARGGRPGRIPAYALGHGSARPPPPPRDGHPLTGPRCSRRLGGCRREKRRISRASAIGATQSSEQYPLTPRPIHPPHSRQALPNNTGMKRAKSQTTHQRPQTLALCKKKPKKQT